VAETFGARLNRRELANAMGKSLPTIDAMVARGMPYLKKPVNRGDPWEFDLAECVDWDVGDRVTRAVAERVGDLQDAGGKTLDQARTDKAVVETRIKEIELAEARGQLVSIDVVEQAVTDMIAAARAKFIGLPAKLAPLVATKRKQAECKSIIEDGIYEGLAELAEFTLGDADPPDWLTGVPGSDEKGVEPVAAATETDGKRVGGRGKKAKPRKRSGAG